MSTNLSFISFTREAISRKLSQLPYKFTHTPDGFPPIFLKSLREELSIPLQIIFETSLSSGYLPKAWKTSVVSPIHKSGNRSSVNNYRPISLTSAICKVMESLIVDELSVYLLRNNLISVYQHGFIKNRFSCTQLIDSLDEWTKALNDKKQVDVIHIDFVKAFDSICHRKLLMKLESFGINYELLTWIREFICGRRQCVMIENVCSQEVPVVSGVPQGSVIGPYLFLIYINDIVFSVLDGCQIRLFADDLKIFQSSHNGNFEDLSNSLLHISDWCEKWQLNISQRKSRKISIGPKFLPRNYCLNGIEVPEVSRFCDIGVIFSSSLKFSDHCSTIASRAKSRAYLILRCFTSNDPHLLTKAYLVYVRPIVEYCTQVWSPHHHKDIIIIEKVQKYFTRRVCQRSCIPYSDYLSRLKSLGIPSLEKRRIFLDLVMVYKMYHSIIDLPFDNFFTLIQSNVATRSSTCLVLKPNCRSNLDCRHHFFANRSAKYWNSLPKHVTSSETLFIFKNRLRDYDLSPLCKLYSA